MIKTVSDSSLDKIKKAVRELPLKRKREVLTMLEEELFSARYKSLLKEFRESAKKYPLSMDEITKEVESVRKRRYESRN